VAREEQSDGGSDAEYRDRGGRATPGRHDTVGTCRHAERGARGPDTDGFRYTG